MANERDEWLAGQLAMLRRLDNVETASLLFWLGHRAIVQVTCVADPPDWMDDGYDDADDQATPDGCIRMGPMTMALELPDELR